MVESVKKRALVTIAIGEKFQRMAQLTHPTLKAYAEKIGAEFIVIDEPTENPHWEKLKLYDMLVKYERILFMDTDVIVRDDCPNLFDIIPPDKLGVFNEGRFDNREGSMREACTEYNQDIPKWDGSYYNTGVMVLSRKHRQLFRTPEKIVNMGMWEQPYLNLVINKDNIQIEELDYKFNRMTVMDKFLGISRRDSYIIHYAGAPSQFDVTSIIQEDLEDWEKQKPDYKYGRNIVLYAGGGMGDQLCAEPVFRFIMNNMFKDIETSYVIISHWPKLFDHLGVPSLTREEYERYIPNDGNNPIKVMKALPSAEESVIWQVWPQILAHSVDYAAVSMINKTIPEVDKTINLRPTLEGTSEFIDIVGGLDKEMILVHPGRGWKSKTFPAEWWENVISGLINAGKRVGIIGKHISDEQGYVDINVPEGAVDLRDLLSLDGFIAAIAISKMVISNDSSPIHIAGAFDNNIILIATCKHPDHVLPYRKGTKYHKAYAFAKKLTLDEWDLSPTRIFKETADKIKDPIITYLPEPHEVVDKALSMIDEDK